MGIPSLFRKIVNDYKDTHFLWRKLKDVDYFYIDFNSIIYGLVAKIDKKTKEKEYEKILLNDINTYLQNIICNVVKPKKRVYIAFDGSVPRAKMIQQRSRRFKSIQDTTYITALKEKHGIKKEYVWSQLQISPGTEFMVKVSKSILAFIKKGELYKHNKIDVVLSDTLVPGEGEHKFMPEIRELVKTDPDSNVVIQSPDGDMIMLSISVHKKNIYLLRDPDSPALRNLYEDELIYLDINKTKEHFLESLVQEYNGKIDKDRYMVDFVFLTFFAGNDFIIPPSYLKIKEKGMEKLITIYKRLRNEEDDYLITKDIKINLDFFRNIVRELAENEEFSYRQSQKQRDRVRKMQGLPNSVKKNQEDMSEYQKDLSNYEHLDYYNSVNPEYKKYNKYFDKINYYGQTHIWKAQYYKYFFNMDDDSGREEICKNYIESLVFNLKYYFTSTPPSWHFFYRYRVSPVMSDLYATISNIKSLDKYVTFKKDTPYLPFEQLMLILPPQSASILPKEIGGLMTDTSSGLVQYYPSEFELDAVAGKKRIYSEPILPLIDAEKVVKKVIQTYSTLSAKDKKRNVNGKCKTIKS
jgi:5'-3' exonuclease